MSERWEFSIDNQVWTSDGRKVAKAATREQAILISSAPDLLEACKMALDGLPEDFRPGTFEVLKAAVAKAEGKL